MKETVDTYEFDLLHLGKVLLKKFWALLLPGVLCAALMFGYSQLTSTPVYEAKGVMYINASTSSSIDINGLNTARDLVSTYSYLVKNARGTLEEVAEKTGLSYSYSQLRSMVTVAGGNDTEFLEITVRCADPEDACLIANTIMDVLPGRAAATNLNSTIHLTDSARVPETPVPTNVMQKVVLGFVIGALLGAVLVVLKELLDDTIQTEDWLRQTFGEELPLLSVVPSAERSHRTGRFGSYYDHYSSGTTQS